MSSTLGIRLLWTAIVGFAVCSAVDIRRLSIPRWVKNGTVDGVVLDCEYVYNENDLRLVVKWFFNDDTEPLYQWIPELNVRHVAGHLYGRLDMDFTINPLDPYYQYRALRIHSATPDLGGKYTCLVTSLAGQDSRHQDMTIYVPARNFRFSFAVISERRLNFTCLADGVYPEPRMKLFVVNKKQIAGERRSKAVTLADWPAASVRQRTNDSWYDISLTHTMAESQLSSPGSVKILECLLEIPGSPYRRIKKITYFSGARGEQWASSGTPNPVLHLYPFLSLIVTLATCLLQHPFWQTVTSCV